MSLSDSLFKYATLWLPSTFFHTKILSTFRRSDLISGLIIGALYFLVLFCEHTGLKTTASATASFLENMAIIIVPLGEALLTRTLPKTSHMLRRLPALCGVGLLTLTKEGFIFTSGEGFLLMAAVFYASAIMVTARLSRKGNAFNIGFVQVCTIGCWGMACALISGEVTPPSTLKEGCMLLILSVICTGFGFTLQPVCQRKLSSEKAGLFCAVNPAVAGFLSILCLHEPLAVNTAIGELLILASLFPSP